MSCASALSTNTSPGAAPRAARSSTAVASTATRGSVTWASTNGSAGGAGAALDGSSPEAWAAGSRAPLTASQAIARSSWALAATGSRAVASTARSAWGATQVTRGGASGSATKRSVGGAAALRPWWSTGCTVAFTLSRSVQVSSALRASGRAVTAPGCADSSGSSSATRSASSVLLKVSRSTTCDPARAESVSPAGSRLGVRGGTRPAA